MKIFLLGLPGSGKTTLGKKLAERLNEPFIDLDIEIERAEGQTINEIFKMENEDYFRKLESKILLQFCASSETFVMATGGGTPCFHDNMSAMNQSGKTIFLDVPITEIIDRLKKNNPHERPLLHTTDHEVLTDKLRSLHSQRRDFYLKAAIRLDHASIGMEHIIAALG